ncbi:MAG: homoserine O-acetyltransferase [Solirubrobacterales bacterium]|nr:homoserine O-acetyltransferase [Solirubrobacterales bacterium]
MIEPGEAIGLVETQRAELFTAERPLLLGSGRQLAPVEVAFETYGELNEDRSNAVFICHALTADAHAAGHHGDPERRGWWDNLIGPGRPVDTDRCFVVVPNLLGGCQGTTGPSSIDPATGQPYGLRFPALSVRDLVTVHRRLLEHLGIERPMAVVGGSLGGMQALQWALDYPEEIGGAALICASSRLTAQNIAFSAVAREAIMRDPDFNGGDFYGRERGPELGLALARMTAHITYLSEEAMRQKFGRRRQDPDAPPVEPGVAESDFDVDFQVESYLRHQGLSFLDRFDANTYLYFSRMMDRFDPFSEPEAFQRMKQLVTRFLVVSFDSDWRFDTGHSRVIQRALARAGAQVSFREIESPWGHDSFLLEIPEYHRTVQTFLNRLLEEQ